MPKKKVFKYTVVKNLIYVPCTESMQQYLGETEDGDAFLFLRNGNVLSILINYSTEVQMTYPVIFEGLSYSVVRETARKHGYLLPKEYTTHQVEEDTSND